MTREEAAKRIKEWIRVAVALNDDDRTALGMAIEALQAQTDGDLISRQDAIEALGEEPPVWYDGDDEIAERNQWRRDKAAIESLPSAEPNTGEWIKAKGMMPPEFHSHHCCSECGNFANMEPPFGNREDLSRYCPNCGARMKGADDDD